VLIVVQEPDVERAADGQGATPGAAQFLREQIGAGVERFSQRCEDAGGTVVWFGIGVEVEGKAKAALQTAKIAFNLSNAERPVLVLSSPHKPWQALPSTTSISARAVKWLQDHFMESIGIEDLARELMMSPSHLSRTLKRELGIGFGEALARIRVACAKDILANGVSAKEASLLVGFRDQSYFTKVFVKMEGMLPSQYVRQLQSI
jgi:AraC-like DNA-binding protein